MQLRRGIAKPRRIFNLRLFLCVLSARLSEHFYLQAGENRFLCSNMVRTPFLSLVCNNSFSISISSNSVEVSKAPQYKREDEQSGNSLSAVHDMTWRCSGRQADTKTKIKTKRKGKKKSIKENRSLNELPQSTLSLSPSPASFHLALAEHAGSEPRTGQSTPVTRVHAEKQGVGTIPSRSN